MRNIATCAALGIALLAAPMAGAKPDHGNKGKGNHGEAGERESSPPGHDGYGGGGFSAAQRSSYADWYHDTYRSDCPPGLAKKHNGCMPPGQAKKRYAIGAPLPHGVVLGPVPPALAIVIGVPPPGYRYGILDGDVVKLAIGTALVVDAIEGLAGR